MAERKMIYLDDAIAALKAMAIPLHQDPCCEDIWERDRTLDNAINVMRGLPSAQPERMRGKWKRTYLDHEAMGERTSIFYCSVCNQCIAYPVNFCPNCGADMRGGDNE